MDGGARSCGGIEQAQKANRRNLFSPKLRKHKHDSSGSGNAKAIESNTSQEAKWGGITQKSKHGGRNERISGVENDDQQEESSYFNRKVRFKLFKVGDLIMKEAKVAVQEEGKLGPKREGPYMVIAYHKLESYWLKDAVGRELPYSWNFEHLRKYLVYVPSCKEPSCKSFLE